MHPKFSCETLDLNIPPTSVIIALKTISLPGSYGPGGSVSIFTLLIFGFLIIVGGTSSGLLPLPPPDAPLPPPLPDPLPLIHLNGPPRSPRIHKSRAMNPTKLRIIIIVPINIFPNNNLPIGLYNSGNAMPASSRVANNKNIVTPMPNFPSPFPFAVL